MAPLTASPTTQWTSFVLGLLATLIILALWGYNLYAVLKEFETDRARGNKDPAEDDAEAATAEVADKKIVGYGSGYQTPPLTVRWMITILRTTAIAFFLVAALYSLINFAWTKDFAVCQGLAGGILYAYQWGKCILYVIFYVRLYYLFCETAAANTWLFKAQTILYMILATMLLTVVITSFQNGVVSDAAFFLDNADFPHFCDFSIETWVLGMSVHVHVRICVETSGMFVGTMAAAEIWMCFLTSFMYRYGTAQLPT